MPYKRYLRQKRKARWLLALSTIGSGLVALLHVLTPLVLQWAVQYLQHSQTISGGAIGTDERFVSARYGTCPD